MVSKIPKYTKSSTVYMDLMTFSFACLSVLLKAPRVSCAFISLNLAFSSYVRCLPAILGARRSIRSVSSCVGDKWLFRASICVIGSFVELLSHNWRLSFIFKRVCLKSGSDGYKFVYGLSLKLVVFHVRVG